MNCTLCSLTLPKHPILDEGNAFCCAGCSTVYKILSLQGTLESYQTHPLFIQAMESKIVSNPCPEEAPDPSFDETMKLHLEIEGMWCPSCAMAISMIVSRQKGIKRCVVDYATDFAIVEYAPMVLSKENVMEQITKLGYHPHLFLSEKKHAPFSLWMRFAISAFCSMNLMMLSYPLYAAALGMRTEGYEMTLAILSLVFSLPLLLYSGWPIWCRFFKTALRTAHFGMETLVFIGVSSAFCYSTYQVFLKQPTHLYYDSMSMVITFVLLGKILEQRAKSSAKETLFRLARTLPNKGLVRTLEGTYIYKSVKEIAVGDHLLARTGEKIVLDGIVEEGEALVDESIMTGEAVPKLKKVKNALIGGSLIKQGALHYVVTATQEKTVLSKILHFVELDLEKKKNLYPFLERLIPFFVPVVLCLALIALIYGGMSRALTVLLICCPCALGIATSLAESLLLFRFAEEGALVRNRGALFTLAKDPFFVFDKTGTLTEGNFRVLSNIEDIEEKGILKAMTQRSSHPLSAAICASLNEEASPLDTFTEIVGRGLEATAKNRHFRLGSAAFFKEWGAAAAKLDAQNTIVYFGERTSSLIEIHLGDAIRADFPSIDGGVLSGDAPERASFVAKACGLKWGKGGFDPLQKREEILSLKRLGRPIIMVGDGVNDAPALAAADMGISVASASEGSIEVSDLFLTKEKLNILPKLSTFAKKGARIIRQNLFWAFFYNVMGLFLAMAGLLTPLSAAAAMVLSSLCVTLNSLRIKYLH